MTVTELRDRLNKLIEDGMGNYNVMHYYDSYLDWDNVKEVVVDCHGYAEIR